MGRTFSRRELLGGAARLGALGGAARLGALGLGGASLGRPTGAGRLAGLLAEERARPELAPAKAAPAERRLVLGTLYGGNDGLNTLVPYDDAAYLSERAGMRIPPDAVLRIGDGLGLHPALVGTKALWDAGHVALIRGVGYPEPNMSHFASMAIWMAASTSSDVASGWLGRWLDATGSDPLRAISIGGIVPPALAGQREQASTLTDSTSPGAQEPPGDELFRATYQMVQRITARDSALENAVAASGTNLLEVGRIAAAALTKERPLTVPGRPAGDIGTQLSAIGELILAGLPTKVYQASMGGFDTHAAELGTQATLLAQLDAAVTAFFNGLARSREGAGTVLLLYTEFGRRVLANASGGTDHGAANLVIAIGRDVRGGFYGEQPSLTRLDEYGNLVHNVDFRSVYATLLERVLEVDATSFLEGSWRPVPFVA